MVKLVKVFYVGGLDTFWTEKDVEKGLKVKGVPVKAGTRRQRLISIGGNKVVVLPKKGDFVELRDHEAKQLLAQNVGSIHFTTNPRLAKQIISGEAKVRNGAVEIEKKYSVEELKEMLAQAEAEQADPKELENEFTPDMAETEEVELFEFPGEDEFEEDETEEVQPVKATPKPKAKPKPRGRKKTEEVS